MAEISNSVNEISGSDGNDVISGGDKLLLLKVHAEDLSEDNFIV